VVVSVGQVEVIVAIESETCGGVDIGSRGLSGVSREAFSACSGNCGNDLGGRVDAADTVVGGIGEVEIVCDVERQRGGQVELGRRGSGGVAGEACVARAGDGGDDLGCRIDATDALVVSIGYVEIASCIESEALGRVQGRSGGEAVVSGEALCAGSGDGGDVACGVDLADDVICGFGQVEVSRGVKDDGRWKEEGNCERRDLRRGLGSGDGRCSEDEWEQERCPQNDADVEEEG